MCLAAFSLRVSPDYPFVFAANRDELHERPSAAADWWEEDPTIYGGRDLVAGGSWLAVDRRGRLAAVTNFREDLREDYGRSRGDLVRDYLAADASAADYLSGLRAREYEYGPFNLILFDGNDLFFSSNRGKSRELGTGIYAVSNTSFDTPWPKVMHARSQLAACLEAPRPDDRLFEFLTDDAYHGAVPPRDRTDEIRATVFINDARYGTRAATVVTFSDDGKLRFTERRFAANGEPLESSTESFRIERG